jgi:hypothetical protein
MRRRRTPRRVAANETHTAGGAVSSWLAESARPASAPRTGGLASTRPLSRVTDDSSKSAAQVSRSPAAMSTLPAERLTPPLNSRLTGDRQTPTAGATVRHAPEKRIFHPAKRERDARPPVRGGARWRRRGEAQSLLRFPFTLRASAAQFGAILSETTRPHSSDWMRGQ